MNGKILLDRKILDWEWWNDVNTSRLFIYLLLRANWKDTRWRGKEIKRGTVITSLASLSNGTNLTMNEVRTCLKHLLSTGEITKQITNRNTLIYLVNYDFYQQFSQTDTKQITIKSQTINKPLTIDEEGNNGIKEKKENIPPKSPTGKKSKRFIPPTVEEVQAYCDERGNGIDAEEFVAHYAAVDWMRGKTKMSNWKMAIVTWEKNKGFKYEKPKKQKPKENPNNGLEEYVPDNDERNKELFDAGYRVNDDGYWIKV